MDTTPLKITNLTKKFDNSVILDDISFSIENNELVALIGSSGAGKTTIMNCITGIVKADIGNIEFFGKSIEDIRDRKQFAREVGIIRQSLDLIDNLSAINNALIGRFNEWSTMNSIKNLFSTVDKDLAINALNSVGLKDKYNTKVKFLSGGEKQRVAIARLILQDPNIILADEPVSSLDPTRSKEVMKLLIEIAKSKNKCLLAGMHSIDLVREYFDRAIGIKNGKIIINKKVKDLTDEEFKEFYKLDGEKNNE